LRGREQTEPAARTERKTAKIHDQSGPERLTFSERFACPVSGFTLPEIEPRLFSFNNPFGACPACGGLGVEQHIDADLVIPDKTATLRKGAIAPWAKSSSPYYTQTLDALARHYRFTVDTKWKDLPKKAQDAILHGTGEDAIRFVYDDGLRHTNYAGTYPKQKSVSGVGQIPARTESDIYGGEFSAIVESLADETHTQIALTHELVHECAFYADFRDVNGTTNGAWRDAGVPCFGGAHPNDGLVNTPMFTDFDGSPGAISVMGGSPGGTFVLNNPRFGMSRLEMYLMGLATAAEVTPNCAPRFSCGRTWFSENFTCSNASRIASRMPPSDGRYCTASSSACSSSTRIFSCGFGRVSG